MSERKTGYITFNHPQDPIVTHIIDVKRQKTLCGRRVISFIIQEPDGEFYRPCKTCERGKEGKAVTLAEAVKPFGYEVVHIGHVK